MIQTRRSPPYPENSRPVPVPDILVPSLMQELDPCYPQQLSDRGSIFSQLMRCGKSLRETINLKAYK
jgi:hypothetical protein